MAMAYDWMNTQNRNEWPSSPTSDPSIERLLPNEGYAQGPQDPSAASTATATPRSSGPGYPGTGSGTDPYAAIDQAYRTYLGRTGSQQEYASHVPNRNYATTIQNSPEAQGYRTVTNYTNQLKTLSSISDPTQWTARYDQLSRDVFNNLKSAGHDVKWQGDNLLVDGRAYTIAAPNKPGTTTAVGSSDPWFQQNPFPDGGTKAQQDAWRQEAARHGGAATGDPRTSILSYLKQNFPQATPQALQQAFSWIKQQYPGARLDDSDEIYIPGVGLVDIGVNFEGGGPMSWAWQTGGGARPTTSRAVLTNGVGPAGIKAGLGSAGVSTAGVPRAGTSSALSSWRPGANDYTPGEIPDISTNFTFDQLYGGSPVDAATEQALLALLQNPSAMDQHAVDVLQAQARGDQQSLYEQEQADLEHLGQQLGIDDSRWIESEKLASRRDRDKGLMDAYANIDIEAARTRKDDERAAIGLGTTYGNTQTQRRVAAAAPILQQEALKGDRLGLREAVKQEAAKIGISGDQLMSQWLLGLIDDSTRRYGIDVGASIDLKKLAQASQEFKEDLALRWTALNYQTGLDTARIGLQADQLAWDQYRWMNGGGA